MFLKMQYCGGSKKISGSRDWEKGEMNWESQRVSMAVKLFSSV
jgi:hypothetical protein